MFAVLGSTSLLWYAAEGLKIRFRGWGLGLPRLEEVLTLRAKHGLRVLGLHTKILSDHHEPRRLDRRAIVSMNA